MPLLTRGGSNPKTFLVTFTLHSNIIRGGRAFESQDFHSKTEFTSHSINQKTKYLNMNN